MDLLFASALWAIPLAALPVLWHLLFRRKSPVVQFSTLRFIKSSVQHTAARKRVQRWLLLACRVLLLALLIFVLSQPVRRLNAHWSTGEGAAAAIVVDDSYSMLFQEGQTTLLDKAQQITQDLLRGPDGPLRAAQVAIFRSQPPRGDEPERLHSAPAIMAQWTPLKPQGGAALLSERVTQAMEFLKQHDGPRWLIILSDLQSHEFPHPLADFPDGHVVIFDLHPDAAPGAGIKAIAIHPENPLPGIGSEVAVAVNGHSGDSRFVGLTVTTPDGKQLQQKPPAHAEFSTDGVVSVPFSVQLPAEPWMLLTATLQQDEPLAWARSRTRLVQTPPRQVVAVVDAMDAIDADRFALALDPSQGAMSTWPLEVRKVHDLTGSISGHENVIVLPLRRWPDATECKRLHDFVQSGGTLVLAVQPGLEEAWKTSLSAAQRTLLNDLLPGPPMQEPDTSSAYIADVAAPDDPLFKGLLNEQSHFDPITVRRFVPMLAQSPGCTRLLALHAASSTDSTTAPTRDAGYGLLFRKNLGGGQVYTWATLPQTIYTTLPAHSRFLPMMVTMCLRPHAVAQSLNVELDQILALTGPRFAAQNKFLVETPQHQTFQVEGHTFDLADTPGLYTWRNPADNSIVAYTNVELPADETELSYLPADKIIAAGKGADGRVVIARSFNDFKSQMQHLSEPEPQWRLPLAIVLFLLCLEAMMGSLSKRKRPVAQPALVTV